MAADELARLKHDASRLNDLDGPEVRVARIMNAAPALIALAEWAEKAKDKIKTAINNLDELDPEQRGMFTSMAESCLVEALAAYPEGE